MDRTKALATVFIVALFSSTLLGAQFVRLAEANIFPIQIPQPAFIIRSDGSVDPSTELIQRDGNVYTFTDDIVGYTIASECDNVVIDGGGYSLIGNGSSTGVLVLNRNNVTVRNMNIRNFGYGIRLTADVYLSGSSSNINLFDNILTGNDYGISISYSSNSVLRNNVMNNNIRNFGVDGKYTQDIDASNTVDGKSIIYWVDEHDKTVPSDAGYVALVNCTSITVQDLTLAGNGQGVVLVYTRDSTVTMSHITNTASGIYIQESSGNTLYGNTLTNNGYGIRGEAPSNNNISSNNITNNENGIYFTGTSKNNVISANTVSANSADGIFLWGSGNTDITENIVANNIENGIVFFESSNNRISGNTLTGNGIGIKLWFYSSNSNASCNHIENNGIGILIDDSFDNRIIGNVITENSDWGMQFKGSQNNNVIYHNSFVNNNVSGGIQVSIPGIWTLEELKDGGGNVWDNGTAGNYWSNYLMRYPNATEIDGTGVGDTRYYINPNNYDRYPLMEPVTVPEFSVWAPLMITIVVVLAVAVIYRRKLPKTKDSRT